MIPYTYLYDPGNSGTAYTTSTTADTDTTCGTVGYGYKMGHVAEDDVATWYCLDVPDHFCDDTVGFFSINRKKRYRWDDVLIWQNLVYQIAIEQCGVRPIVFRRQLLSISGWVAKTGKRKKGKL